MSLCNDQQTFNHAIYKALKSVNKREEKRLSQPLMVYSLIHLIFLLWGVMLALRHKNKDRVVHITMAIVFAPAYVLAYYLDTF